ncbi:TetR/AcrR family transcriptional regulator [Agromyces albus]|uniref:TetR/AcrR family transcriptional regulator n=1 Tax=Agromyces albus TaxID=205332 RepID=A0A4Q2KT91_9MICO|nr:TetR/AcrR family transcriptional regulator [Agromyces albus]RXZ68029.1 TetR/AcrR family transcriptional regulator [Agromyces albus]
MPTIPRSERAASGRPATFTEEARRSQLVSVTIDLVARYGYRGCSLQRIADAAGISKAAVIYHFESKDAVIRAAYDRVIESLTESVAESVSSAPDAAGKVDAYVTALVGYMSAHPTEVRMIVEARDESNDIGVVRATDAAVRWAAPARLIDDARRAGVYPDDADARNLAVILGGAIDGVVAEHLADPDFDLQRAAADILALLHGLRRPASPAG